jgi:hypothetical protein
VEVKNVDLPSARHSFIFGLDEFNNRLIISTGQIQSGATVNDLNEFKLDTNQFNVISLPNVKPTTRYGSSGGNAINGWDKSRYFYITHGFSSNGRAQDTFRFDIITNTMTEVTPSTQKPLQRCLHGGVVTSPLTQYIFGGCASGFGPCPLNDLWRFDGSGSTGTWTQLTSVNAPSARQFPAVAPIYNGDGTATDILIYGGSTGGNEIHLYNIKSDSWSKVFSNAPDYEGSATATKVTQGKGSVVYIFGGGRTSNSQDLYLFNSSSIISPKDSSNPSPICYGKTSTDPKVCSGKGSCNSTNVCICTGGFSGNECQNAPLGTYHCKLLPNGHKLEWKLNPTTIDVNFTISKSSGVSGTNGYSSLGFNVAGVTMTGASIVLGYGNNLNEYKASGFQMPSLLTSQKISNKNVDDSNGFMIQFRRPLSDSDTSYIPIKSENMNLLISYNNQASPTSSSSFSKHTNTEVHLHNFYTYSECVTNLGNQVTFSFFLMLICLFLIF